MISTNGKNRTNKKNFDGIFLANVREPNIVDLHNHVAGMQPAILGCNRAWSKLQQDMLQGIDIDVAKLHLNDANSQWISVLVRKLAATSYADAQRSTPPSRKHNRLPNKHAPLFRRYLEEKVSTSRLETVKTYLAEIDVCHLGEYNPPALVVKQVNGLLGHRRHIALHGKLLLGLFLF